MRTFFAIELTDEVRKELSSIQERLIEANADIKWVKPENIHLTLKFLGDINESQVEKIKSILDETAKNHKAFKSSLFKIGAFPKLEYPRVIWVGIDENCSIIEEIAIKIDDACEKLGFQKEERQFSAHLTVGRVRSSKNKAVLREKILSTEIRPISFPVTKLTLFQSTLTPQGPVYTSLHESQLI